MGRNDHVSAGRTEDRKRAGERSIGEKFAARRRAWSNGSHLLRTEHTVHLGDARVMAELDGTAVHLIVTSPPYWDLKEYASDRGGAQLGHIRDEDEFLAQLARVWRRCLDVLVLGGRLCVVVGDVCRSRRAYGRHVVEPLHARILLQCRELGFDPLAPIIWSKIANMATEVAGNGAGFLGKPYEPNAIIKNDVEFILLFRKPGDYRHPTQEQRDLSLIEKDDQRRWFRQVWTDVPGEAQRGHPAPFPREIARRLIGMFSFVGDTVLDPFWGAGNTTLAAIDMNRSSIGFEIEPTYLALARKRIGTPPMNARVRFVNSAAERAVS